MFTKQALSRILIHYIVRFTLYNILGAVVWAVLFVGAGFFFGNLPFVQKNFTLVVLVGLLEFQIFSSFGILVHAPNIPALLTSLHSGYHRRISGSRCLGDRCSKT
jgi:hypothetical protein